MGGSREGVGIRHSVARREYAYVSTAAEESKVFAVASTRGFVLSMQRPALRGAGTLEKQLVNVLEGSLRSPREWPEASTAHLSHINS
jgi:hypothetical protein